ncbi:hypothetical protein C8Q73DRAFT_319169 [Cubamyces lactineus]|nr:hypothetical protein C8Q73DRAFT_319169 [Cubamyces lactineus]
MARRKGKSGSVSQAKDKDKDHGRFLQQDRVGFHTLPIEVMGIVFEHSAKPTLLVCTRVSRLWRESSRPHLFESLTIRRSSSYDDFFSFLDANTDIARYVRNLTLGRDHAAWLDGTYPLVSKTLLVKLTHMLPRLQELRIQDVQFDSRPTHSDAAVRDEDVRPPRLRLFSMERCCSMGTDPWVPQSVLFDVLSTLSADTIHLSSVYVASQETAVAPRPRLRPLNPRCLVLSDMPSINVWHGTLSKKRLYEVLRLVTAPKCLRELRVDRVDRHDIACLTALGDFLSHAAQDALQEFELPFPICQPLVEAEDTPERWSILGLDKCRNIKSFGISFNMRTGLNDLPAYPHVPYSAVAIAILSHLPSTLRQLTIKLLYVETDEDIKNKRVLGLRALDDALVGRFPALEVVRVELRVRYFLMEYTTAILRTMPKCKKRGILEVAQSPDT